MDRINIHDYVECLQLSEDEKETLQAILNFADSLIELGYISLEDTENFRYLKPAVMNAQIMAVQRYITLLSVTISTGQVNGKIEKFHSIQWSHLLEEFRHVLSRLPWYQARPRQDLVGG